MTLVKTETVTVDERSDVLIQLDEVNDDIDALYGELNHLRAALSPISRQHRVTVEPALRGDGECSSARPAEEERRGPEKVIPMIQLLRDRLEQMQLEMHRLRHSLQLG